jgi:hypothetical protein
MRSDRGPRIEDQDRGSMIEIRIDDRGSGSMIGDRGAGARR